MKKRKEISDSREKQKAEWEKEYTKEDRKYILQRLKLFLPNLFASNYNRTKHPFWKDEYEFITTFDRKRLEKELSTDDLCQLYCGYDTDGLIYDDETDYGWDEEDIKDFRPIPCKDPRIIDIALCWNTKSQLCF